MEVTIVAENLDDVPEALHEKFEEADGTFTYSGDVTALRGLFEGETTGLKTALSKERQAAKDARAALKQWEGMDFEEVQAAIKFKANPPKSKKDDVDFEVLVQERVKGFEEETKKTVKALQDELDSSLSLLDTFVVDGKITEAAIQKGVRKKAVKTVVGMAKEAGWVRDEKTAVRKDGENVVYGATPNQPQTPTEWVEQVLEEHDYLAEESTGPGTRHQTGSPAPASSKKASDMSRAEKSAYIEKYGGDAWNDKLNEE